MTRSNETKSNLNNPEQLIYNQNTSFKRLNLRFQVFSLHGPCSKCSPCNGVCILYLNADHVDSTAFCGLTGIQDNVDCDAEV